MYMYICVYMYICMFLCVCVYSLSYFLEHIVCKNLMNFLFFTFRILLTNIYIHHYICELLCENCLNHFNDMPKK